MESKSSWIDEMLVKDKARIGLGIDIVSVGDGKAVAEMTVRGDMCNGHLTTHGGYIFLLADTAFAFACNSTGLPTVAAGAQIRFIRPTRVGDKLVARAAERSTWGRSGIYDVSVWHGDELVAEFRGDSRVIKSSPGFNGQASK